MQANWFILTGCLLLAATSASEAQPEKTIHSLRTIPAEMIRNNTCANIVDSNRGKALEVRFSRVDYPNVYFPHPHGVWDWSDSTGFAIDIYNPDDTAQIVSVRLDNQGADGTSFCTYGTATAEPKAWTTLKLYFSTAKPVLWGMRGIPGASSLAKPIDLTRVTAFQVYLDHPDTERTVLLSNARVFGTEQPGSDVKLPFVDRYGQYKHDTWPGKLSNESEFASAIKAEQADMKKHPASADRDAYGGLLNGPKLKATGWFRAEKVSGRWWLVTPDGHVFFSLGMDCINPWQTTFVTQREKWFDWLPAADDPRFGFIYSDVGSTHSMAETIGGKGRAFSFYMANLKRIYGDDWMQKWRDNAYARLKSWGFNTIANWAHPDVMDNSPIPFTASVHMSIRTRYIEGAKGYWGRMYDVYDPGFAESVDRSIAPMVQKYKSEPKLLGYFVDNELSWETIDRGTLASPVDQPCRIEFIKKLQIKYSTLDALNKAWGTSANNWDELRAPENMTDTAGEDLASFGYDFAKRYFEIVKSAIHKYDKNHLYLGCRFSGWAPESVARASADVCDVVSYNIYSNRLNCETFSALDAPIIIGEFHFGALDRGMFHTGLVDAKTQQGRADRYTGYLLSAADCPSLVGVAWFQYIDQAITGRCLDGENYNIGFVNVIDQPYPELVDAARKVHSQIYNRHINSKSNR